MDKTLNPTSYPLLTLTLDMYFSSWQIEGKRSRHKSFTLYAIFFMLHGSISFWVKFGINELLVLIVQTKTKGMLLGSLEMVTYFTF